MKCPNCKNDMTSMTLDGRSGPPVTIDVCAGCQAFWFDRFESIHLSPGSTLKLMKLIGEHSSASKPSLQDSLECPRCSTRLLLTRDMQRNMRFSYWRCENEHGRFTGFFEFLKEKKYIRPLSPKQIKELRQNIQIVNCSSCGAAIDLAAASVCSHCRSPISMLDMKQSQELLDQLKQAAEPKPPDPQLPAKLVMARLDVETSMSAFNRNPDERRRDRFDLVQAGLDAVGRLLDKLVI